jgi:hypothetical protein
MSETTRTAAEERFETYLSEHGYQFAYEPDVGSIERPDYLVSRDGLEAVCEVKQFETSVIGDRLEMMGGSGSMSPKHIFGATRGQLDAAARQLKPLASDTRPLVVVLSNSLQADVDLSRRRVISAMYGNPASISPSTAVPASRSRR